MLYFFEDLNIKLHLFYLLTDSNRFSNNVIRLFSLVNWCTTVANLKLTGSLTVPFFMSINLPSLKTLHLDVEECVPTALKKLLRGSPALELCHLKQQSNVARFKELKIVSNSQGIRLLERNDKFDLVIQSDRDYDFIPDYLKGHLENVVSLAVHWSQPTCHSSSYNSAVYLFY